MGTWFSKRFDPVTDIPHLDGRIAIVTGANSGIGYQSALQLASHGAKVYLTTRSEQKALDTIGRIERALPALKGAGRLQALTMELSSISSAKAAAEAFLKKENRLDILINNAGTLASAYSETPEGISTVIAANHIGPFVFTTTLLPVLEATAKLPGSDVRVVNVSSSQHSAPPYTTFSTLSDFKSLCGPEAGKDSFSRKMARYGQSKLANILFTKELQRRWDEAGVPAVTLAVHPGGVATEGSINFLGPLLFTLLKPFILTPLQGAITPLFAATAPVVKAEATKWKASYLVPYGKVEVPSANARDAEVASNLWALSEKTVGEVLKNGNV
ncbi:NAD-P-binding protein [Calocera viscosa TUFC12733]|uniref:NAD-P-binding protein n=1 Tax=Calocera viscosa (strain TUFC12733) TaxID=1330018 RepID=A0A167HRQ7_CALVF|nr:NAD-P-binding protein [Calocera viscosa TUFC12733]